MPCAVPINCTHITDGDPRLIGPVVREQNPRIWNGRGRQCQGTLVRDGEEAQWLDPPVKQTPRNKPRWMEVPEQLVVLDELFAENPDVVRNNQLGRFVGKIQKHGTELGAAAEAKDWEHVPPTRERTIGVAHSRGRELDIRGDHGHQGRAWRYIVDTEGPASPFDHMPYRLLKATSTIQNLRARIYANVPLGGTVSCICQRWKRVKQSSAHFQKFLSCRGAIS